MLFFIRIVLIEEMINCLMAAAFILTINAFCSYFFIYA
ncbi:hypothetical protein M942_05125 [Enterobacter ludwigii]|nr:hypothetical protein M942_05125 [Enterobacter ludwigii]